MIGLLVGAPLLGAAVLLVGGRYLERVGHWVATALAAVSLVLAATLFFDMLGRDGEDRGLHQHLFSWIPVAALPLRAIRSRYFCSAGEPGAGMLRMTKNCWPMVQKLLTVQ